MSEKIPNVNDLKAKCRELGITGYSKDKREDLLKRIEKHLGGAVSEEQVSTAPVAPTVAPATPPIPVPAPAPPMKRRAESLWNRYIKENNIAIGKITPEQKAAYQEYKAREKH
jgi:hypothetical protein